MCPLGSNYYRHRCQVPVDVSSLDRNRSKQRVPKRTVVISGNGYPECLVNLKNKLGLHAVRLAMGANGRPSRTYTAATQGASRGPRQQSNARWDLQSTLAGIRLRSCVALGIDATTTL